MTGHQSCPPCAAQGCLSLHGQCGPPPTPGHFPHERGMSLIEVMVIAAVISTLVFVSFTGFKQLQVRYKLDSGMREVQSWVRSIHMNALKEKVRYRIVLHDQSAGTPNQLEIQRFQSGSYVTVPDGVQELPDGVQILASSMDNVVVSSRGRCSTGNIYFNEASAGSKTVAVKATCDSNIL